MFGLGQGLKLSAFRHSEGSGSGRERVLESRELLVTPRRVRSETPRLKTEIPAPCSVRHHRRWLSDRIGHYLF